MREKVIEYSENYRHNYSVLATPAEGLSGRFTKKDRKTFGVIPGVTDNGLLHQLQPCARYIITASPRHNGQDPRVRDPQS